MKKPRIKRRKQATPEAPARITNETVAEHREKILAGGRRFKYPHQYARHKLVINAILISLSTLIVLAVVVWWQLYPMQNTSTFFYRLTRILPVPVASVDGASVRYSDYLVSLSGSKHYLEQTEGLNLDSADGRRQIEYLKRQALDSAIADTYAAKIAREKNITVSDREVEAAIDASRDTVSGRISREVYDDSAYSTFGYEADEYRDILRRALLHQKVAYAVDGTARAAKVAAEGYLRQPKKPTLGALATQLKKAGFAVQAGSSGSVPLTNHDGGLTQTARQLTKGKVSAFLTSTTGDGYYLVQLTSKTDTQLSYDFLKIPLTEFDRELQQLASKRAIKEYISVSKTTSEIIYKK